MTRPFTGRSGRFPTLTAFVFLILSVVARDAFADTVRGRVVDPQDRPIAHAGVLILRGQTIVAEVTTDADGQQPADRHHDGCQLRRRQRRWRG